MATMQNNKFDSTHLRLADPGDLQMQLKNWAFPAGSLNPPEFFYFLAAITDVTMPSRRWTGKR
jgi:hypothetical protein